MLLLKGYTVFIFVMLLNNVSSFSNQLPLDRLSIHVLNRKVMLQSIFTIRINESGQIYNEIVKIDSAQHLEYFFVPPYKSNEGADFILDFEKNLTLIRIPTKRICYVSRKVEDDVPNPQKLQKDLLQPLKPTENLVTDISKWRVSGMLKYKDILHKKMKQMCRGLPVSIITPIKEKPFRVRPKESTKRSNCGGRVCYWVRHCYIKCARCQATCKLIYSCRKITC